MAVKRFPAIDHEMALPLADLSERQAKPDVYSHSAGDAFSTFFEDTAEQVPVEGTEVRTMELDLDQAIRNLKLSTFPVWRVLSEQLREPKLFSMDYDPRDFRITEGGTFTGMADLLLTYRGDFPRCHGSIPHPSRSRRRLRQGRQRGDHGRAGYALREVRCTDFFAPVTIRPAHRMSAYPTYGEPT